jgi:predicted P-loop ATPase
MQSLQQTTMQSLPSAAAQYGRMGWPIFPLLPRSKKPRTANGFYSATADPETIERWWTNEPEANIGLHCRNRLVLDIDGAKGRATLAKLEAIYGKLPPTMSQNTPRGEGGKHLFFSTREGLLIPISVGKIGWDGGKEGSGLDVRSQDGYIVLAPSIHPDTKTPYEIDTTNEMAECPEWLLNLALATKDKPASKQTIRVTGDTDTDDDDLIPEGGRNDAMMSEAGVNARRFRNDPDLVSAIVHRINDTRCDPPLEDDEIDKIVTNAIKYAAQDEVVPVFRIQPPSTHAAPVIRQEPDDDDEDKLVIPPGAHILTAEEIQEIMDRDDVEADMDEALGDSTEVATRSVRDVWAEWGLRTVKSKSGDVFLKPNRYNAVGLLTKDPDWTNSVFYDEFSCDLVFSRDVPRLYAKSGDKVADGHLTLLTYELQADSEAEFGDDMVVRALETAGRKRATHPVRQYLNGLTWDGTERIDMWLIDYLGAANTPLIQAFGSRWLIAAVARIMQPGAKVDTCLILEGGEGVKKSTTLKELVPNPKWFTDAVGDFTNKDTLIALRGKWIVEIGELTTLTRSGSEPARAFISRQTDTYRGPYGRVAQDWDRQFVLSGTSNNNDYLQDENNRRFWVVVVHGAEEGKIAGIRDQLWAEALVRYRAGEKWWLHEAAFVAEAKAVTDSRITADSWDGIIERAGGYAPVGAMMSIADVLSDWIGKLPGLQTKADGQRVGRILHKIGWEKKQKRLDNGTQPWFYFKVKK